MAHSYDPPSNRGYWIGCRENKTHWARPLHKRIRIPNGIAAFERAGNEVVNVFSLHLIRRFARDFTLKPLVGPLNSRPLKNNRGKRPRQYTEYFIIPPYPEAHFYDFQRGVKYFFSSAFENCTRPVHTEGTVSICREQVSCITGQIKWRTSHRDSPRPSGKGSVSNKYCATDRVLSPDHIYSTAKLNIFHRKQLPCISHDKGQDQ